MEGVSVFYSYSHQDEGLCDELRKHLSLLRRQGIITDWHDRKILAGADIDVAIATALPLASIILLGVSADFITSEYCWSRELKQAMNQHTLGISTVVPVILRPCDWHSAPFGKLKAVPKDGKPITTYDNPDEAYCEISVEIRRLAETRCASRTVVGAVPVADNMPTEAIRALNALGEAASYARLSKRNVIEYAVKANDLFRLGIAEHALRLLSDKGFIEHVEEITRVDIQGRVFRRRAFGGFDDRSCIYLTESGEQYFMRLAQSGTSSSWVQRGDASHR